MIYVCDAVMGSGKTSAIINYINDHPDERFIYITPFLNEADRIFNMCPAANFERPSVVKGAAISGKYSKLEHTRSLIASGRNIVSTHALFKNYDSDILKLILDNEYKLIIDENVEVAEGSEETIDDINLLVKGGFLVEERNDDGTLATYSISPDKTYSGGRFDLFFRFLRSKELTKFTHETGKSEVSYYWVMPPELIDNFSDVFVLTYMFEGQGLHSMFELYDMEYVNIGVQKINGKFCFDFEHPVNYVPEHIKHIEDYIDIVKDPRYNFIGNDRFALSMSWFNKKDNKDVEVLKSLMRSCYTYLWKDSSTEKDGTRSVQGGAIKNSGRLWGTYLSAKKKIAGKGYANSYLVFNSRATNEYSDAKYLIYAANLFVNVRDKKYYEKFGITLDDDQYALSTMLQWIWRSAIRDGKPIHIYIPSRRMRELLINWMNSFKEAG